MFSWLKDQVTMLSLVSLFLCAFLLYSWIDSRVTIDHARQEQEYQLRKMNLLQDILKATGIRVPRSEMIQLIRKQFGKNHIIKEGADSLQIDDIIFKFKGESFDGVEFLN
jgi:hypothetical protein